MATFSSWAAELERFRNALSSQSQETLLQAGWTSGSGQTVTFKRWEDVIGWLHELEAKAAAEANSGGKRRMMISMGYAG